MESSADDDLQLIEVPSQYCDLDGHLIDAETVSATHWYGGI